MEGNTSFSDDNADSVLLFTPRVFYNRELSWIQFNRRVLEEAQDRSHPLLERVKFLSIFSNNLDEFVMIRLSGLWRQAAAGALERPPDGLFPTEQIQGIRSDLLPLLKEATTCWKEMLLPELEEEGIHIHSMNDLSPEWKQAAREIFLRDFFPIITPMAFDVSHPFPFISNLSLNLAVIIDDKKRGRLFSRIKVPRSAGKRFVRLFGGGDSGGKEYHFVLLEELIAANLDLLFPGMEISASYPFRVTRDADFEIKEDEASDLLTTIEEGVEHRRIGKAVRLEVDYSIPPWIRDMLAAKLHLEIDQVDTGTGPLQMADLMELTDINRPELKDTPFLPFIPEDLEIGKAFFSALRRRDYLLYHPYDSFNPVVSFIRQAARDPDVLAIKQTLYRVGAESPVVSALMEARERGKQVTVLVELKARFDEENNITWARALERAGVHVVYGLIGLKVHAKLCMVVRREQEGLVTYTHIGSGNYNAQTARVYTDLGIFTSDPDVGSDTADLFNALTGYSVKTDYRTLLVSHGKNGRMRDEILKRIDREILRHKQTGDGFIAFKCNALVDPACITALYRASREGVSIHLQVRGICCLRPQIPGLSDRITVSSIVGRFLEHTRIYYFRNGGDEEVLIGSADLMPRNLDRRVEVLYPVRDKQIRSQIIDRILTIHLKDTVKMRQMNEDGSYTRVQPGREPLDSQLWMIQNKGVWHDT
ncbi:MAG: polyphosphate kinase 1 [Methanocalculus sp. MSAO_Arc2]|uniref:polyphosphate kinase 1 n=1 Tax=Methanocalculus sp. MSAO_Arc2 TaxID=2293855 RepID=UPI000FF5085D|nr:MAG: polyphosphate kinase 1 [Methanocalculus sp. MSAO_Arc2]